MYNPFIINRKPAEHPADCPNWNQPDDEPMDDRATCCVCVLCVSLSICLTRARALSDGCVRALRVPALRRWACVRCALCDARVSDRVSSGQDIDHPTWQSLSRISARESTQVRHCILRARDSEARVRAHTYRAILCARHRGCRRILKIRNMLFSSFTAAVEDIEDVLDLEFINGALLQGWSNDDKNNRSRQPRCLNETSESSKDQRVPRHLLSRQDEGATNQETAELLSSAPKTTTLSFKTAKVKTKKKFCMSCKNHLEEKTCFLEHRKTCTACLKKHKLYERRRRKRHRCDAKA